MFKCIKCNLNKQYLNESALNFHGSMGFRFFVVVILSFVCSNSSIIIRINCWGNDNSIHSQPHHSIKIAYIIKLVSLEKVTNSNK